MKPYMQDNDYLKGAARALNILYTYDRSYEPYLVYWLFPLQLAYQDTATESESDAEPRLQWKRFLSLPVKDNS